MDKKRLHMILTMMLEEYLLHIKWWNPFHNLKYSGLCAIVTGLQQLRKIRLSEEADMLEYLRNNRPKPGDKLCDVKRYTLWHAWWWKEYKTKPRIAWLKREIKAVT